MGWNAKLEIWRDAVESKYFCLSRTSTEYMKFEFSKTINRDRGGKTLCLRDTKERDLLIYWKIIHKNR